MERIAAQRLIEAEMTKHGLMNWEFQWARWIRYLGRCYCRQKRIEVSLPFVSVAVPAQVRDTILHEIAHALVWEEALRQKVPPPKSHGSEWKAMALKIGARPQAKCDDPIMIPSPNRWRRGRWPDTRQGDLDFGV
jgi:predicted SprT family Zn-dependent metalloprotease